MANNSKNLNTSETCLTVATPLPLRLALNYRLPDPSDYPLFAQDIQDADTALRTAVPGARVRVPLGSRTVVGVILKVDTTKDMAALKPIVEILDAEALLDDSLLALINWAVAYYQHPVGLVFQYILPSLLRQGRVAEQSLLETWVLTPEGLQRDLDDLSRSPKQGQLIGALRSAQNNALSSEFLNSEFSSWRNPMQRLETAAWVSKEMRKSVFQADTTISPEFDINTQQRQALEDLAKSLSSFYVHLLHGVTGSGKTEVYLRLAAQVIGKGQQVLVMIPEIGLSPQMLQRFRQRLAANVVLLHSGLSEKQRLHNWLEAKQGNADVVVGTRLAVFTPLPRLGLIIVDEEHDLSFKQQEGFRFFARDVAIKRAQLLSIPVVLGSATPSLESLQHAWAGKYQYHQLTERVANAAMPPIPRIIDVRGQGLQDGLSNRLLSIMRQHLDQDNQVLLFLNRRGYAPTLLCHQCGWIARCQRCDSHMTLFRGTHRQRCHHCGAEREAPPKCPDCQSDDLVPWGEGTERVEQTLIQLFPNTEVLRIDRDSMRKKDALALAFDNIHRGGAKILLGTQMLAKGHHFPDVTFVGILNIDQGLFSTDFRALERMAQLIVQVSGRAGRAQKPGEVALQTHYPEHPSLISLLNQGYSDFAQRCLTEREMAAMPPYCYLCLLRAESPLETKALQFLQQARSLGEGIIDGIRLLGPVPAPMVKRAGRYRAQLLIHSNDRLLRQQFLHKWVPLLDKCQLRNSVRWSLDVDPMEMF